ncbi:hypothetical protein Bhyg_13707 [Pseudolycoriella hygida]|uniref:Uncharacterized protein n=1 Tax=Pseudolycoriella hygida TaxID=35572 RepID=A0A9Q0MP46_9DIPT|nr:hypothetical protein Bhyg_13707 [Pseudolycoriella hygida]
MKSLMKSLVGIALIVAGCHAGEVRGYDPHSHYVQNTDPCDSQCQYYGQVCPILTFAPTGPGYDCNRGYCRLSPGKKCTAVPRNAYYAENTDACQSLCRYSSGCPIRPATPTPPGFNCNEGYCRRTPNGRCIREMCYIYDL